MLGAAPYMPDAAQVVQDLDDLGRLFPTSLQVRCVCPLYQQVQLATHTFPYIIYVSVRNCKGGVWVAAAAAVLVVQGGS